MVDNTVKSGIKPITFDYRDVTFYQKDVHLARTFMVFHSLELGALTFDQYRFVARRTPQGEQVMKRQFERVIRLIPRLMERDKRVEYFILPAIPKLVISGALVNILYGAFALYPETLPSAVCVEISADILFEDIEVVKARLIELRELGVKVAISEVGDEFCPAFKLSELPFDLILLDKFTTERLSRPDAERILSGMIAYLHSFGVPVIAPDLDTEEQISMAKTLECDGYSSIHADPLFPQEEPEPEIPEEPEEIPEEIEEPEEPEEKTEEEPEEIPEELTVEVTEQAAEEIPAQPEEEETPEEPEEPEEPEVYVTVFAGAFRRPEPGTRKGLDRTIGRTAPKRDGKREIAKGETAPEPEEVRRKLKRKP
jgi:EAL domain-containing protein (putative c-di-GMP-specific phosphodiesterase class I)